MNEIANIELNYGENLGNVVYTASCLTSILTLNLLIEER
jgi:hypothetical protein